MRRLFAIALVVGVVASGAVSGADPARATEGQTVSVGLTGAYEYDNAGVVIDGFIDVSRAGANISAVRGAATIPGAKAGQAEVSFDIRATFGFASGSIHLLDPASGIDLDTFVLLGRVRPVGAEGATGTASWIRLWRLVQLPGYTLEWSVGPTDEPPPAPPAPADDSRSGSFDALTYNVAGLIEPISGSRPTIFSEPISPLLNDYDLVLTQENFFFYRDLIARHTDHPYVSAPATPPLFAGSRPSAAVADGLNRFSRFPFDAVVRVRWPGCFGLIFEGAGDCLAEKGFSVARTRLADGAAVDVYNLHAEAGSDPRDQALQVADFELLARHINEHSVGAAVIVGGDTNLHTEEPEDGEIWDRLIAETGLIAVCTTLSCGASEHDIDRFAYRSNDELTLTPTHWDIEAEKFSTAEGIALSDHDPVTVTFDWSLAE